MRVQIEVRLGPGLATAAGARRLRVALPQGATVDNLLEHLRSAEPAIAAGLDSALPVVGGTHASRAQQLAEGDQVALLMPVAGGAAAVRQSKRRAPWP
jgi:molybdopterin converting factor small subunit